MWRKASEYKFPNRFIHKKTKWVNPSVIKGENYEVFFSGNLEWSLLKDVWLGQVFENMF